jgi:2-polyprenyl-6-hydroxyphenyl methylase/3-demethylubiquinone-9 3-methyltransferase
MSVNADPQELEKFSQLAHRWWDPNSEFKPLQRHQPAALALDRQHRRLVGQTRARCRLRRRHPLEAMAGLGADVTGIDLSDQALQVAQLHLLESKANVAYRKAAVEALAREQPASFDVVTCMEVLEHIPQPAEHVAACVQLLKPDGHAIFAPSTGNPKSFLFAIVGAEYVLNLLPRGTHQYAKFIRTSELSAGAARPG